MSEASRLINRASTCGTTSDIFTNEREATRIAGEETTSTNAAHSAPHDERGASTNDTKAQDQYRALPSTTSRTSSLPFPGARAESTRTSFFPRVPRHNQISGRSIDFLNPPSEPLKSTRDPRQAPDSARTATNPILRRFEVHHGNNATSEQLPFRSSNRKELLNSVGRPNANRDVASEFNFPSREISSQRDARKSFHTEDTSNEDPQGEHSFAPSQKRKADTQQSRMSSLLAADSTDLHLDGSLIQTIRQGQGRGRGTRNEYAEKQSVSRKSEAASAEEQWRKKSAFVATSDPPSQGLGNGLSRNAVDFTSVSRTASGESAGLPSCSIPPLPSVPDESRVAPMGMESFVPGKHPVTPFGGKQDIHDEMTPRGLFASIPASMDLEWDADKGRHRTQVSNCSATNVFVTPNEENHDKRASTASSAASVRNIAGQVHDIMEPCHQLVSPKGTFEDGTVDKSELSLEDLQDFAQVEFPQAIQQCEDLTQSFSGRLLDANLLLQTVRFELLAKLARAGEQIQEMQNLEAIADKLIVDLEG